MASTVVAYRWGWSSLGRGLGNITAIPLTKEVRIIIATATFTTTAYLVAFPRTLATVDHTVVFGFVPKEVRSLTERDAVGIVGSIARVAHFLCGRTGRAGFTSSETRVEIRYAWFTVLGGTLSWTAGGA